MKLVSTTYLKKNLKSILLDVKSGKSFIITYYGQAVAEIAHYKAQREKAIARLKKLRKTAVIGDLVSPLNEPWEAK